MINQVILKDRALMLKKARSFFFQKNILEVDTPALSKKSSIDLHIDVLKTLALKNEPAYLHTSPEYGLKRLLSQSCGDIYQMSHVFRFGELGPLHNPEFMLVEWYREKISYPDFLKEVLAFIALFLGKLPFSRSSYRQAFLKHTKLDSFTVSSSELYNFAAKNNLGLSEEAKTWKKDTLLNLIMTHCIEKNLGLKELFIIDEYPASQAALSQIKMVDGFPVSERFEIYYQGIELANGYLELTDAAEQKKRLLEANEKRKAAGKEELPIDEKFISALKKGLPDCYGVAVGFDRLLMLRHKKTKLKEVLTFAFDET